MITSQRTLEQASRLHLDVHVCMVACCTMPKRNSDQQSIMWMPLHKVSHVNTCA